ncbi:MAG: S8 family serine peptidase [Alistipes sp.]|nr:S8 family serine peptidase [Alistipes sp.]
MNRTKLFILALAGIFTMSCATDNVDQAGSASAETAAMRKFVNTPEKAVQGELVIYVNDATAQQLETSEVATRSGVTALDAVAVELGAEQLKPVFNLKVNADRKRELGMHRWYTLLFSKDADLEAAATALASLDEVERVQFSTRIEVPKTEAVEVDPAMFAATRSAEMPFDDPMLQNQWHYNNDGTVDFPNAKAGADVNLFEAWKLTTGRPDVIVAVVDEGVCHEHEDLNPNMHVNEAEANGVDGVDDDQNGYVDDIYGYNFVNGGKITWKRSGDSGHGTHVAGTVAAVNNNGTGVCGVAGGSGNGDGVRIISCQIISGGTAAGVSATAAAVEYAADNGACVLQNSWGFGAGQISNDSGFENGSTSVEATAFLYFMQAKNHPNLDGGIIIFAAGNDGKAVAGYPAAWNKLIAVSAIAPDGLPTYYTCYDRGCNVSAPGGEYYRKGGSTVEDGCVLSILPGNKYALMQGTSMACPHVSGIAALAISYAADNGIVLTLPELKDIVVSSVTAFEPFTGQKEIYEGGTMNLASYNNKMGTGLIDAFRALMAVRGTVCIPIPLGEQVILDISNYIGNGKGSIKMLQSEISDEVKEKLGITDFKFMGTKLVMTCTKPGSALVTFKYVAGGSAVGGGQITGGMETQQEFALIVRPGVKVDEGTGSPLNPGGWL